MISLCQDSWTRAHCLSRIKPPDRSLLSARPLRYELTGSFAFAEDNVSRLNIR